MLEKLKFNRRAWIDFFVTLAILGVAFVLAFFSSVLSAAGAWIAGAASAAGALLLALIGGLYIVPKLARRVRWEMVGLGIRTTVTTEGMLFITVVVVYMATLAIGFWADPARTATGERS